MTYNIPGVFTSVIDRSYIQPAIIEGRSVLIAGFSKYGEDKFYEFGDADTMKFTLGEMDIKRYGQGLMYGLGALTKTRNVIFKRLLPEDAKFANLMFRTDGETETRANIIDANALKRELDDDPGVSIPPLEPREYEFYAADQQTNVFWEYNPDNIVVWVGGTELSSSEYTAINGTEILFTNPITQDRLVNLYTVMDNTDDGSGGSLIQFVNWQYIAPGNVPAGTDIAVPGGYEPTQIWITLNGLELSSSDFVATDGTNIRFTNDLLQDDIVRVHSAIDSSGLGNQFIIYENVINDPSGTGISVLSYSPGYNPELTLVSVNGVVLGKDDYLATDETNIYFATPVQDSDIIRLHTVIPGDTNHYFGALIAKARGEGYNDLYVQFRPAPDVEKFYADEEGDVKYRFNFLKATVLEQTSSGQREVANEFIISLTDIDPETQMPIISTITGENLYINDKFARSNEFVEFYLNESFLPEFYKELNIDELTKDTHGNKGENRLILKDTDTTVIPNKVRNIEWFLNNEEEYEKRAVSIEGKDKMFLWYRDPSNHTNDKVVSLSMFNGELIINEETTAGPVEEFLYVDGTLSFYKVNVILNPDFDPLDPTAHPKYILRHERYQNWRMKLWNMLNGGSARALWNMQSGSDGDNLILNGRLNLGEANGSIGHEDAKMLMMDFYKQNEVIHEVLYPELDFDYVPDWTQDIDIMNEIVQFSDEIGFTMPIIALPRAISKDEDYKARVEDVYLSSFNTLLYSGQYNDNHYLETMGTRISGSTAYYAMINHLNVDEQISITEPMANMVKGQLPVAGTKLSYIAKSPDIEKLRGVQINTIIKETDGIYFIDQLTAYKAASKLSRANVVKVIHRMRKDLPRLLKDLLQHKATKNILNDAKNRVELYMKRWIVRDDNIIDGIFSEVAVNPVFVHEELKLIVSIAVNPIGTIEKIEVPITVY